MSILKVHQKPMTIDEQVENLQNKGLIINDENYVRSFLNNVSYFRLIKAYSIGLKDANGNYNTNVHFEDIANLYIFDTNFRQRLYTAIEKVEIILRCRLSNYFSMKYGVFSYNDINNFNMATDTHIEFIKEIQRTVDKNTNNHFIKNFRDNYDSGNIPLYALVELLSFGTISKFYKNMKNEDKKAVAALYGISYKYFESWIESIAYVRNICAHYGRLYNIILAKKPILYKKYKLTHKIKNDRIFAILITLKHILPNDKHWYDFIKFMHLHINEYSNVNLQLIGFPQNWKDVLLK